MLRWFPTLQVATACFSCSPPDLNFLDPYFIFMYTHYNHCHRATAHLQLYIYIYIYIYIYYYIHKHKPVLFADRSLQIPFKPKLLNVPFETFCMLYIVGKMEKHVVPLLGRLHVVLPTRRTGFDPGPGQVQLMAKKWQFPTQYFSFPLSMFLHQRSILIHSSVATSR